MDEAAFFAGLHEPPPLPIGTRIELIDMPNDPDPIVAGARGEVSGGNGAQLWIRWDNGRSLMLLPGIDHWRVIHDEIEAS